MTKLFALILACLALGLVAAGCGDDDGGDSGGGSASTTEEPAAGGGGGAQVGMQNIQFDPRDITVKAGETITFTNDEAVPHDVHKTSGPGDDFSSGDTGGMQEGDTFELKLDQPGKYDYVCKVHAPGMAGSREIRGTRSYGTYRSSAPQTEAAQQQQRGLSEPAACGQEAQLRGRVVEVEEAAGAADGAVRELQVVESVDGHEAVGGRERLADVGAVGAERAPGNTRVGAAEQRRRRGLHAQVRKRVAELLGVRVELVHAVQQVHRHGVLVGHVRRAAGSEARALPRRPPLSGKRVDRAALELRAHGALGSSAMPSSGDDACA